MKNVDIPQIVAQIGPLVGPEDPERQTDERPDMHGVVRPAEMMADVVDLGMAVMAAGDAVIGAGFHDLLEFDLAVFSAGLGKARLQEPAAAAAAVVVGFIRGHLYDVFLTDHRFDDKAQIVGDGIAKGFADNLAGILDGEFDLQILVPVGVDLQPPFPDPLGIVRIDGSYFKLVLDSEFFQSSPD